MYGLLQTSDTFGYLNIYIYIYIYIYILQQCFLNIFQLAENMYYVKDVLKLGRSTNAWIYIYMVRQLIKQIYLIMQEFFSFIALPHPIFFMSC